MTVLLADLEQVRLLEHIKTSGLTTSFTDLFGNAQGASVTVAGAVYMERLSASDRCVQVRINGNEQQPNGNVGFTQLPMVANVFSRREVGDDAITEGLAKSIRDWLLINYNSGDQCIINIEVQGCTGPYYTEESRVYFEIPMIVKFGR